MTIKSFEIVSTDPQLYVVVTNDDGSTWGQIIELPVNISAEEDVKEYVWKFLDGRAAEMEKQNAPKPNLESLRHTRETVEDRIARLQNIMPSVEIVQ